MSSGYCGTGDALPEAVARFAVASASQLQWDHEVFAGAISRRPSLIMDSA
ncbi:hypothetical protein DRV85_00385 [Rhodosalinus halophilus]|uniref:Uncharacterized protein n=1 Tax=Rhodosalinus halophilus TaxID=2259333 RepID=A0A365UD08_9RHOB|nr:hypothetical protein DRV85_00385 [Rhodosalinus halophilus]